MSTRLTKKESTPNAVATGYEGNNVPDDFSLPPCTIEDVDRALFNLFDKEIPLNYVRSGEMRRIPVIFATGERFAVLRRKKPLTDKNGALILPLVSIMRTSVTQEAMMGPGQNAPMTVKKRLSKDDRDYQRAVNKAGLLNQASTPSPASRLYGDDGVEDTGTLPGRTASRRRVHSSRPLAYRNGRLLEPKVGKNIYEIITIPPVKFYEATYEVTFWAQYTQQMNDMLMSLMSVYQNNHKRTFKLETEKGYYFVGYVGDALTPGNNFDGFTDDERLVRYSFDVRVPGYVLGADYPGAPPFLRKFVSAPEISFSSFSANQAPFGPASGGPRSGDPDAYLLDNLSTEDSKIPGSGVGANAAQSGLAAAGSSDHQGNFAGGTDGQRQSATIGGFSGGPEEIEFLKVDVDPLTGEKRRTVLKVKSRDQRKGETVLRAQNMIELELDS